ncbi:MAG: GGDEF domain-containing protein [Chrysiogenetes bacterium]|nr:GGDEF domain-containing protein [Chrysiogenetes bacterium]
MPSLHRQRQGLIKHWSEIDRAMAPALIMLVITGASWAITAVALLSPHISQHYNVPFVREFYIPWHQLLACVWIAEIAWGLWARKRRGTHPGYILFVALTFAVGATLFCYFAGLFVGPFIGGYIAATVIVLILFEPRPAYIAVGFSLALLIALWLGEVFQIIPSSPLLKSIPLNDGVADGWWVGMIGSLLILISIITLGLTAVMISRERRSEAALLYLSETDFLTGLRNRRAFLRAAHAELSRAQRHQHPIAMAMLDLDHFKYVNDEHGHDAGDEVLACVAEIMQKSLRAHDHVGRWGGEEFVLVLSDIEEGDVRAVLERLRLQVEQNPCALAKGKSVSITVSIGYTIMTPGPEPLDATELISAADQALYRAKTNGRNQTAYLPFEPSGSGMVQQAG